MTEHFDGGNLKTAAKLVILEEYLDVYTTIMNVNWGGEKWYIDTHAGTGRTKLDDLGVTIDGSAIIALDNYTDSFDRFYTVPCRDGRGCFQYFTRHHCERPIEHDERNEHDLVDVLLLFVVTIRRRPRTLSLEGIALGIAALVAWQVFPNLYEMATEETRARSGNGVVGPNAEPMISEEMDEFEMAATVTPDWRNFAIPIATMIVVGSRRCSGGPVP